tara:strand:+ start:317 stop:511 length:195 start_codon:yes stop_codon:yes gene_type:complete
LHHQISALLNYPALYVAATNTPFSGLIKTHPENQVNAGAFISNAHDGSMTIAKCHETIVYEICR